MMAVGAQAQQALGNHEAAIRDLETAGNMDENYPGQQRRVGERGGAEAEAGDGLPASCCLSWPGLAQLQLRTAPSMLTVPVPAATAHGQRQRF